MPSGSGRDAAPKVPSEFENLDWLSNHINHKHVAISNLPTQEVSDIEESADLAVDTLDEGQDLQSEFKRQNHQILEVSEKGYQVPEEVPVVVLWNKVNLKRGQK